MTYMQLNFRQLGELLKALGNGRIGFDHKRYTMADLQRFIAAWIAQGNYTAAHVGARRWHSQRRRSSPGARAAAPQPAAMPPPAAPGTAPVVNVPVFAPRAWQPLLSAPVLPAPPQPFAAHVADVAADVVINDMLDAMQPQPYTLRIMTAHRAASRCARSVRGPADVAALLPDACSLLHYGHPDAPIIDSLINSTPRCCASTRIRCRLISPFPFGWLVRLAPAKRNGCATRCTPRARVFRVNYTRNQPADVLGDMGLEAGNTSFQYGPAAQGFRLQAPSCA
jgi:hypothetical protein